ncbi:hypothetical protein B0J18DRAFT_469529 [Chaetomium sp. MPI-SDFR-AT-0129]|nr:hypothetical protein B0J18DRAFT_469529 [Chaetomium sp. MPI-SDFR-AT-0129]
MGLLDRIQAKIELFRLEQRYTRRRHRRSTFVSNAIYVDGEYIYQSPNTTGSSANTSRTNSTQHTSTTHSTVPSPAVVDFSPATRSTEDAGKQQKRLNRWSSMPGFGSSSRPEGMGPGSGMPTVTEQDWRKRTSLDEARRY